MTEGNTGGNAFDLERAMQARREGRTVPITSFTIDEAVANGTFRWKPPLLERSGTPYVSGSAQQASNARWEPLPDANSFASIWAGQAPTVLKVLVNESEMNDALAVVVEYEKSLPRSGEARSA